MRHFVSGSASAHTTPTTQQTKQSRNARSYWIAGLSEAEASRITPMKVVSAAEPRKLPVLRTARPIPVNLGAFYSLAYAQEMT